MIAITEMEQKIRSTSIEPLENVQKSSESVLVSKRLHAILVHGADARLSQVAARASLSPLRHV